MTQLLLDIPIPSPPPHLASINQLRDCDRAAHRWYRFVLSYPPHFVQTYAKQFGLGEHHCLFDPFAGTGTTVVEGKKLGIPSLGIEASPMAWFAGTTKIDWSPDPKQLMAEARAISQAANFDQPLKTLPPDQERLLIAGSISPLPLHKVLVLLSQIEHATYRAHLRLAIAQVTVSRLSNLRFAPGVSLSKPKEDPPVVQEWLNAVAQMASDLDELRSLPPTTAQIYQGDARAMGAILPQSIDAVITSPPYPNETDYTRATRLESVLLGFIQNRDELRQLKQGLLRSNSKGIYRGDADSDWVKDIAKVQTVAAEIEARRVELGKDSGFERRYSAVVLNYFGGLARHLAGLRPLLKPGAQLAYVVGDQKSYFQVLIRTGELLAEIAESLGYTVNGIDLFRTRFAASINEQIREEVVLLRWSKQ